MSVSPSTHSTRYLLNYSGCVEELEELFLSVTYSVFIGSRSEGFIYSYSSLIQSQSTCETSTQKNLKPTKYSRQEISDQQYTYKIKSKPMKYPRENSLDPQDKVWTHKILTR